MDNKGVDMESIMKKVVNIKYSKVYLNYKFIWYFIIN